MNVQITGEFDAYVDKLNVIIDILSKIPLKNMPVSFVDKIVSCLNEVASMIADGHELGKSWRAGADWKERKNQFQ